MTLDPRRTLAIVCGADSWPKLREFEDAEAFRTTATAFRDYLTEEGLGLPEGHVLWLFGESDVQRHLDRIAGFLRAAFGEGSPRGGGWTVLFFYTGHGFFPSSPTEYCLALHDTRPPLREETSLRANSLGRLLRAVAPDSDRVLVVDACFAAAAVRYMQASLDDVVERRVRTVLDEEPVAGPGSVAVLCASDQNTWAELDGSLRWTTFGRSLLDVLTGGRRGGPAALSLREVCEGVSGLQRSKAAPAPELHVPVQAAGDLSKVPLFPNPAWDGITPGPAPEPVPRSPLPVPDGPVMSVDSVRRSVLDVLATQPDSLVRSGTRISPRLMATVRKRCGLAEGDEVHAVLKPRVAVRGGSWAHVIAFTDSGMHATTGDPAQFRCGYDALHELGLEMRVSWFYPGPGHSRSDYYLELSAAGASISYGPWSGGCAKKLRAVLGAVRAAAGRTG
ncbi:hypothetical protein [Streptomyces sp. WMMC1477]|uniref:hypothetical protein n=1 Tax=Streptomyces sp. WMMC1477 TaxID=3015155 RepID=UPI0022B68D49|nr:hypothetical protein [Streptomyces sp. WMMC1477]MCZ7432949.1 hypothetical protein [Streptomyces sp. WMMC1477]